MLIFISLDIIYIAYLLNRFAIKALTAFAMEKWKD